MSALFSALTIKELSFRNRLVISPMCQYSAVDGFATDWHLVHLGSRAVGGAGLIIQEATAVAAAGRISPGDLGIWQDEQAATLQRITSFIKEQGAVPGIQLAHAGRKASCVAPWQGGRQLGIEEGGWETIAPSAIAYREEERTPVAMTIESIQQLVTDFARAARRAVAAGYQVLELHAAHGYLIHEFLSPLSNERTDQYGGSFENRIRLLLEIIEAVHEEWPARLPLFVRLSATDWLEGGWTENESVQLAKILKTVGVDLIDCSSGGLATGARIPVAPSYQVPFAERIKKEAGMLTGAVGLITAPQQADDIISSGQADMVLIARESLRDPNFPLRAARQLGAVVTWPSQYERAKLQ